MKNKFLLVFVAMFASVGCFAQSDSLVISDSVPNLKSTTPQLLNSSARPNGTLAQARTPQLLNSTTPQLHNSTTPQPVIIGYLSYQTALQALPQYAEVQQKVKEFRQSYEAEMKRVEDEFNQKYEDFLDGRDEFPRTILLKRQTELQEMMQRNIDFRKQAREELRRAEDEAMAPLQQQVKQAVATVAANLHLAVVFDTDRESTLFLDPTLSVDITDQVIEACRKK